MKHLLSNTYPLSKNCDPTSIVFEYKVCNGMFALKDCVACNQCKSNPTRHIDGCDEEIVRLTSVKNVGVLRFDTYIAQFHHKHKPQNCDYLLFDDEIDVRKVAFCDLTCSLKVNVDAGGSTKYPEGKRVKARNQMMESLNELISDSLLAVRVLSVPSKIALFGWREYIEKTTINSKVLDSMRQFGRTVSSKAEILTYDEMALSCGFKFVEVRYPAIYRWNDKEYDFSTYEE